MHRLDLNVNSVTSYLRYMLYFTPLQRQTKLDLSFPTKALSQRLTLCFWLLLSCWLRTRLYSTTPHHSFLRSGQASTGGKNAAKSAPKKQTKLNFCFPSFLLF